MDIRKFISLSLVAVTLANIAACGTIIYPERRGQAGGRIDPAIAILDGTGLLFFIIPGVIAFAVDFSNGSIYLPGGRSNLSSGTGQADPLKIVKVPKDMDAHILEQIVLQQTHVKIHLDDADLSVQKVASLQEAQQRVALFQSAHLQTASALP